MEGSNWCPLPCQLHLLPPVLKHGMDVISLCNLGSWRILSQVYGQTIPRQSASKASLNDWWPSGASSLQASPNVCVKLKSPSHLSQGSVPFLCQVYKQLRATLNNTLQVIYLLLDGQTQVCTLAKWHTPSFPAGNNWSGFQSVLHVLKVWSQCSKKWRWFVR